MRGYAEAAASATAPGSDRRSLELVIEPGFEATLPNIMKGAEQTMKGAEQTMNGAERIMNGRRAATPTSRKTCAMRCAMQSGARRRSSR